ncbi:MAG: hypothetical protein WDZ36_04640, partial [Balneolaceae bacterium]
TPITRTQFVISSEHNLSFRPTTACHFVRPQFVNSPEQTPRHPPAEKVVPSREGKAKSVSAVRRFRTSEGCVRGSISTAYSLLTN